MICTKLLTLGAGVTVPRPTATSVAKAVIPSQVIHQHSGQVFLAKGHTCQFCQFSHEVGLGA